MQVEKKSLSTAKSAKDYLSKNEIPQLFECLMTGLMYHRPSDHIIYLQECLERIKKQGVNGVRWDMFLEAKKTPLPPIDATPREDYRPQPLPDIGSLQLRMAMDASVIIIQTGPGMDKKDICKHLAASFPNYVQIELGTILRERALLEAQDPDSRWRTMKEIINEGELASDEFVIETLIKELNKHSEKKYFIIEGFPRTTKEQEDFERFIGFNRVKFMLLVDCEEEVCQKRLLERGTAVGWSDHNSPAINKRILNYKSNTLAVCKHFDDQNKLRVVDGDKARDLVMKDIHLVFTTELNEVICPHPPSAKQSKDILPEQPQEVSLGREPVLEIKHLAGIVSEEERNPELPQCRFGLLLGGPGSGKSEAMAQVCGQYPTWIHMDINDMIRSKVMNSDSPHPDLATCGDNPSFVEDWKINIDILKEALRSIPDDTEVVIIEGFPKTSVQLNEFNSQIGRADFVILLDSEEDVMRARLSEKFNRLKGTEDDEINSDLRMFHFKNNGLSICRYFDELGKMCIVSGDRDREKVASEIEKVITIKLEVFNNTEAMQREKEVTEENKIMNAEIEHAAAIKIQASVRGHLTRKELNRNNSNSRGKNIKDDDEDNNEKEIEETKVNMEVVIEDQEENVENNNEVQEENVENNNEDQKENVENNIEDQEENVEDNNEDQEENVEDNNEDNVNDLIKLNAENNEKKNEAYDEVDEAENEELVENEMLEESEEQKYNDIYKGSLNNDEDLIYSTEDGDTGIVEDVIVPVTETMLGNNGVRTSSQLELADSHVVLLLGGPGSGKTTLGDHLVSKFAIPFIHVDRLIMETESGDEDSEELKKYLLNEECDETPIYSLIRKKMMDSLSGGKVIFIAGFPKTLAQYHRFSIEVCPVAATIFLDVEEDTLKTRLAARADPELPLEYIDQLEAFKNNYPKLLEKLEDSELFSKVDGTQEIEEVFQQVNDIVENFNFLQNEQL